MSCIAANNFLLIVARDLHLDCYNHKEHSYFDISKKPEENDDHICDITLSSDNKYLAIITSVSKKLIIYDLPQMTEFKCFILPRSASKIRFSSDNANILVADKSGDVLIYDFIDGNSGTKLLGHLSLLLDVLQTYNNKYIITCDRDEKIRVSCYPNTYNIQTYCLGHKEFVNHIEILPHNDKFLTSSSGDGTVICWDYENGKLCYTINAYLDVDDNKLSENFYKIMDEEGVEISRLPIVHYTITKLDKKSSLIASMIHSFNKILIYKLETNDNQFKHQKEEMLLLKRFPAAMVFIKGALLLYDDVDYIVSIMSIINCNDKITFQIDKKITMFEDKIVTFNSRLSLDAIKILYKRKFDNVQEYQERKKQRIEKLSKLI
ncbi:unnamed protein product [Diatraea saccharalis]|uniref:tRNA (guanine-N(7)-)-methyltransferase non-catalytic subunit wuho n=1 Tax=Diatraea saccharalis TaxID=40085 RepID=A0A9N9WKC5_9NEOP|nr:unnamed protein product [Diatraea saccharalis]